VIDVPGNHITMNESPHVQVTELIRRRKVYPNHLKSYLRDLQDVRNDADYEQKSVSKKVVQRQLKKATEFVELVTREVEKK